MRERRHSPGVALLLAILVTSVATDAVGAAWVQPPGGSYSKIWLRSLVGRHAILADGSHITLSESYSDFSLNAAVEYGITPAFTLIALGTPLAGSAAFADSRSSYMGFLGLGGRVLLWDGITKVSIAGDIAYNPNVGTSSTLVTRVARGKGYFYVPAVNTHRFSGALEIGQPWSWGWLVATLGGRTYSNDDLQPTLTGFLQLGYNGGAWTLDGHANVSYQTDPIEVSNISGAGQTRYVGVGIGMSYWLTQTLAVNLGLAGAPYFRANAAAPVVLTGIEIKDWR